MKTIFHNKKTFQFLSCAAIFFIAFSANAAQKIYSPYVEEGELEFGYFGSRSFDDNISRDNEQKQMFSVGYGVNSWWKTELYGKFKKDANKDISFNEWEWENLFQITERGEYMIDVGASLAYEWTPPSNHADTVEARLLLGKDVGKTSHTLNIVAEKNVGSGPREDLEGKLLWSSRYNHSKYFSPGFEVESDFGELDNAGSFDEQKHYVGPAAYGKIPLNFTTKSDSLKYRVGYLFGISDQARDGQLITHFEYEIHF